MSWRRGRDSRELLTPGGGQPHRLMSWRFWGSDTLFKRLLIPYLLTSLLIGGSTLYNLISINTIVSRINATYQSNADLFLLGQTLGEVQTHTESYLSTRSSTALENYYRASASLLTASGSLNERIVDSESGLLQRNIRRLISTYLELTEQAVAAKRGRDVVAYTGYFDRSRTVFGYIRQYTDRLNSLQFELNYRHYQGMGRLLDKTQILDVLILVIILTINLLIVMLTALRITRPITALARSAEAVAGGNLAVDPIAIESHDEVNVLAQAFNTMIVSLRAYVEQIRVNLARETAQKERDLRMQNFLQEARFKNLQAQINPHFLFNSLNAGAQMAMMEGSDRTSEFIEHVADFYRYNINLFDQDVALAQEVKMVDDYIYIQKVRFADRISYESDIDPACLTVRVPGLILQPIVENAFAHGLRDVEEGGLICVRISDQGDHVTVRIHDNGKGMPPGKIARILERGAILEPADATMVWLDPDEKPGPDDWPGQQEQPEEQPFASRETRPGAGIGLTNVIGRLRLYYHRNDVVSISSGLTGQGTEFILRLPKNIPARPDAEA